MNCDCSVTATFRSGKTQVSVLHANFISCRVSFVLRCFYKSTLVVCAVARTVSRSV